MRQVGFFYNHMVMKATVTDDIEDERHEPGEKATIFKHEDCLYCLPASYQFELKAKYSFRRAL